MLKFNYVKKNIVIENTVLHDIVDLIVVYDQEYWLICCVFMELRRKIIGTGQYVLFIGFSNAMLY